MFYGIYNTDTKRLLTVHAMSGEEHGKRVRLIGNEPVVMVGQYPTNIAYIAASFQQPAILIREGLVRTNDGLISNVVMLDPSLVALRDRLLMVQIFSGMRILGTDEVCRPVVSDAGKLA